MILNWLTFLHGKLWCDLSILNAIDSFNFIYQTFITSIWNNLHLLRKWLMKLINDIEWFAFIPNNLICKITLFRKSFILGLSHDFWRRNMLTRWLISILAFVDLRIIDVLPISYLVLVRNWTILICFNRVSISIPLSYLLWIFIIYIELWLLLNYYIVSWTILQIIILMIQEYILW